MNQLDLNGSYTYADYLKWRFQERVELFKGKILKMSPAPSREHQKMSLKLTNKLFNYFEKSPCDLYVAPFDVRLVKSKSNDTKVTTVVQPDLCVICDENKLDDKGCNGAPDLVVEILSPGNSSKEMGIKFDLYEENGVKEYWIVDPTQKIILVYTLQNEQYIGLKPMIVNDKIKSPLFPQLDFDVKEIFV
ncbi:MAG: Uma2 family endonuclease [Ferruginibacter sp.]|nr:Uma2 family endonuclease [Ferruginibacter sp.]